MSKRLFYSLAISIMLPLALVALAWVVASGNNRSYTPAIIEGQQGPNVPSANWGDIVAFPTVTLGFDCCESFTGPLYLKRAAAAGYPPNGKVYVFGGRHMPDGSDVGSRWIWEYNPANNTLTQKNALLDQNQSGSRYVANMVAAVLTSTIGPRIYIVGGSTVNGLSTGDVRVYDPNTDTLSSSDTWPAAPARVPGGYAVYNNKLYIFGGHAILPASHLYSDTWVFDPTLPSGQRWTKIDWASLSIPRAYIAGAELDGYIYAIGGDQVVSNTVTSVSTVERMNPSDANPTWQPVASVPWALGDASAWAYDTGSPYEIAGRIVIAGGGYPVPSTSALIYNPTTNSWNAFPDTLRPRRNYAAAELNGFLYVWGGYDVQGNVYNGSNSSMAYNATGSPPPPAITPSATPSPLPVSCEATTNYTYTVSTGVSIDPGTVLVPNTNCSTCFVNLDMPFPVRLYGRSFTTALVGSTGNLQFGSDNSAWINRPLPWTGFGYSLFPYWRDLEMTGNGDGIYTSTVGTAPGRTFNIEWRGVGASFELRLHENATNFEYVYGANTNVGTVGVQKDLSYYTSVGYNVFPPSGTEYNWVVGPCTTTPTPVPTNPPPTATGTGTASPIVPSATIPATVTVFGTAPPAASPTVLNTQTVAPSTDTPPPATETAVALTATPAACEVNFTDVPPGSTFYSYVQCLACVGIVNGYPDGTFKPNKNVIRGQLAKIVSNAAGLSDPAGAQLFADVQPNSLYYPYVQRLGLRGYMSGYPCGGQGEPCLPGNLPYFRPYEWATRGEISKIVANAAVLGDPPGDQIFADVSPGSVFYDYVQRLASRGYMNGYTCGGPHEPCDPESRPYFRPNNYASRGQTSKIVANTFMRDCLVRSR